MGQLIAVPKEPLQQSESARQDGVLPRTHRSRSLARTWQSSSAPFGLCKMSRIFCRSVALSLWEPWNKAAMQICLNPGEKLYPEFLQVIKLYGKLLKGQVIFIANNASNCKGCVNSKQISRSSSFQCLHAVVQPLASSRVRHKNKMTKQEITKVMSSFENTLFVSDKICTKLWEQDTCWR